MSKTIKNSPKIVYLSQTDINEKQISDAPEDGRLPFLLCIWHAGGTFRKIITSRSEKARCRVVKVLCSLEGDGTLEGSGKEGSPLGISEVC